MAKKKVQEFIPCSGPKLLPESEWIDAARDAISENPANRPGIQVSAAMDMVLDPQHLAALTSKYWRGGDIRLGVAFLDNPGSELRRRILDHMNAWNATANVQFLEASPSTAEIRLDRAGSGYWSYLGVDCRRVPAGQATMNLQGFTMSTPESEYRRVVRHETGHALGFPHEHLRRQIIQRLDVQKTLAYFRKTQGWNDSTTRSNVLTPLQDDQIVATPEAEEGSIMAYSLPGSITKDGRPIVGGKDITPTDAEFAAKLWPKSPLPPPPPPTGTELTITAPLAAGKYKLTPI